jgi:hypothetical protein
VTIDAICRPHVGIVGVFDLSALDAQKQVVMNGELRKDAPLLGNITKARLGCLERRKTRDLLSLKDD